MQDCCICCQSVLPNVQNVEHPGGTFSEAMGPLFDKMEEYTEQEKNVIKSRVLPLIDATEREAKRAEWWDTRMFLIGFGSSLIVTITAAINIASFVSAATRDSIGAIMLILSSIGTTALGLRERLKFHEKSVISKQLSTKLQRHGFLFLSKAYPYNNENRNEAYTNFVTYAELAKDISDKEHMKLKSEAFDDMFKRTTVDDKRIKPGSSSLPVAI